MTFDQPTMIRLMQQLEETGYANDEQFLGAAAFEHHHDEIVKNLAELGYHQALTTAGQYYEQTGALYWKYDEQMLTSAEAQLESDSWITTQAKKK